MISETSSAVRILGPCRLVNFWAALNTDGDQLGHPLQKEPRTENPGLNANVAAALLREFGNDNDNLERTGYRRIE